MKKTITLLAVVLTIAAAPFGNSARANDQSSGCGLGWSVFKKNSLVSSSLRNTTNVLASNTSAMTTGSSGCSKHDIVKKEKAALYFAEANYQKLINEIAEGKGEHVQAFAKILGCNNASSAKAAAVFQSRYESIYTTDQVNPQQMLNNAANALYGSDIAAGCGYGV